MVAQTSDDTIEDDYRLATRALNSARTRLNSAISVATKVGYDTSGLEKARAALELTKLPDGDANDVYFNEGKFNQAFQPEAEKLYASPGGKSFKRTGELISLARYEGNFDFANAPYADQIVKEFGQESPYTAAMAMRLAQDYGVKSLSDLSFYEKVDDDGNKTPYITVKSTGKEIPTEFASYDNGGTNKNGGATFYFSWALNPDGTPTLTTRANPRAGGFINDFVKPILPVAALFIPLIGPQLGATMLAGTALAGNAFVAAALGNATLNLGVQALAGNIKNGSDVLKIMGAAGVSAGIAYTADLVNPNGTLTPGGYTTDAGKLVEGLTGGAISGKFADIVGGAMQGGLTGLATDTDPGKAALMGSAARLSSVMSQQIATSTGSLAIGNAVGAALTTAITTGKLDAALVSGGISGLNTFLNETLAGVARDQRLTPTQTSALKAGGALALQTIVAGAPNAQQAIQTIVTTLKNDYDANKKKLPVAAADPAEIPKGTESTLLALTDDDGNIDLMKPLKSSIPPTLEGLNQYAVVNAGTMTDISNVTGPRLDTVVITAKRDPWYEDLARNAAEALGINIPEGSNFTKIGEDYFNGIVDVAKKLPKNDPNNSAKDLLRGVSYTVLSGVVEGGGSLINTLNGVLKVVGATKQGGSIDVLANRVKVLSDALTPEETKRQQEVFQKEFQDAKTVRDVIAAVGRATVNSPRALLKEVVGEITEEGLEKVIVGPTAKLLSLVMTTGKAAGRSANFAYDVMEAVGGTANEAAQATRQALLKDLQSGKITQKQYDDAVEVARAKGAVVGLTIGSIASKIPDLPKVTDATVKSQVNRIILNPFG